MNEVHYSSTSKLPRWSNQIHIKRCMGKRQYHQSTACTRFSNFHIINQFARTRNEIKKWSLNLQVLLDPSPCFARFVRKLAQLFNDVIRFDGEAKYASISSLRPLGTCCTRKEYFMVCMPSGFVRGLIAACGEVYVMGNVTLHTIIEHFETKRITTQK